MNIYLSIFYRLIPLIMALLCFSLGFLVLNTSNISERFLVGSILISLSGICIALFSTAATIIRQIIKKYSKFYEIFLPTLGFGVASIICFYGIFIIIHSKSSTYFVAGHVIFGVGCITYCVSTVALSSTKFSLIPKNSSSKDFSIPITAFSSTLKNILISIPIIVSIILWIISFTLLKNFRIHENFVAGFVTFGLAAICTSLIGLVVSIVKQIRNEYNSFDKKCWISLVIIMGTINIILGILILTFNKEIYAIAPGYVLIGLGMICYSISSKIILLALVWKTSNPLAGKVTLIPVLTALFCLFLTSFLIVINSPSQLTFIPERVLIGLGAICFSLFSIVSILESATSK